MNFDKTILYIAFVIVFSCRPSESNKENEIKSDLELEYDLADMSLTMDAEKVQLISLAKEIPITKVKGVLREYLVKTRFDLFEKMEEEGYYLKIIDTIAKSQKVSKKRAAIIIFSYKYEMITEEEILEKYSDEYNTSY